MREVEITTQHLISDGFDIGTDQDPYKNFVYTSFQELATNISHKRVGQMARKKGNALLGKMCTIIAGDEMRHHLAYREFVKSIFGEDPSGMMLAFADMMKKKIGILKTSMNIIRRSNIPCSAITLESRNGQKETC